MLNESASKIVLELPEQFANYCLQQKKKHNLKNIIVTPDNPPHITLAMGIFDYTKLQRLQKVMRVVAYKHNRIQCAAQKIVSGNIFDTQEIFTYIPLELSKKMRQLHQDVMRGYDSYFLPDVSSANFLDNPAVDNSTMKIVETYANMYAYRRRNPHIILGEGQTTLQSIRKDFTVKTIALWKMGHKGRLVKRMYSTFLGG